METQYDEAFTALIATEHKLEEKEKLLATCEQDISSLCRRLTLLEAESWTAESRLGQKTIDLANTCKLTKRWVLPTLADFGLLLTRLLSRQTG